VAAVVIRLLIVRVQRVDAKWVKPY